MSEPTKTPTLKDVAADAGIHFATASRALSSTHQHLVSPETRERVLASAQRLGYRVNTVARSLRSGRTGTIGVLVFDLANPFTATVLRGIDSVLEPAGQLSVVMETHNSDEAMRRAVERLTQTRVDAIIAAAARVGDLEYLQQTAAQVPVVLAVRRAGADDGTAPPVLPEALQDDVAGAADAARHLLESGHRRVAQVVGDQRISSFVDRERGFRDVITAQAGTQLVDVGEHAHDSTIAEGRRLASVLLELPEGERPTAIFAHNDMLAVGVLDAIADAGLTCPADVSVIGYNDAPLSDHLSPPLTTVKLPAFEIGEHAARMALAAGSNTDEPERVMLSPQMVLRESVAPPAG